MKTLEQVQKETKCGEVFTFEDFFKQIGNTFTRKDGIGYFHDGEKETRVSVWCGILSLEELKRYPFVCWYIY